MSDDPDTDLDLLEDDEEELDEDEEELDEDDDPDEEDFEEEEVSTEDGSSAKWRNRRQSAGLILLFSAYAGFLIWLFLGNFIYGLYLSVTPRKDRIEQVIALQQQYNDTYDVYRQRRDTLDEAERQNDKQLDASPNNRVLLEKQISIDIEQEKLQEYYHNVIHPLDNRIKVLRKSLSE